MPLGGSFDGRRFTRDDLPPPAEGEAPHAEVRAVSTGYFETAGIDLLSGRRFDGRDGPEGPPVAVVDRETARRVWPGEDPVGRRITLMGQSREVVGVVGAVRQFRLDRPPDATLYLPVTQAPTWLWRDSTILVRTDGPAEPAAPTLVPAVRSAVGAVDSEVAVDSVRPMTRVLGATLVAVRFRTALLGLFAALALLLGAVGLYGVVAYAIAGRSREIGLRMALGAQRRRVLALVMRQGLGPALAGTAVGLAGALAVGQALAGLLYGVEAWDPATFLAASGVLLVTAAFACYLPARRALRIDPAQTLRS